MKRKHHKKHPVKHRRKQPSLTKTTTDMTKLTVTGLIGMGLISTVGANIKNIGK